MPIRAKKWILLHEFVGEPKLSDFKLEEEDVPGENIGELQPGGESSQSCMNLTFLEKKRDYHNDLMNVFLSDISS